MLKDFITFILTAIGLIIAGFGLSTWRRQIKGTKEFEAFYNLNYSLLKLKKAIKYVRNPAIWPSEEYKAIQYAKNKYGDDIDKDKLKNDPTGYVYEMRWEKISDAYSEMESHLLAVQVLWGSEILEKIKPIDKKIKELNIALRQNFGPLELKTKENGDIREIIYDMSGEEDDNFSNDIKEVINDIYNYLKQKID
ncbi:MAG: hypothetical protein AAB352_02735 [Patescibacteria group bacterium]